MFHVKEPTYNLLEIEVGKSLLNSVLIIKLFCIDTQILFSVLDHEVFILKLLNQSH